MGGESKKAFSFSWFLPFGAISGKNCFVKRATHFQFRKQKVEIGMGLIQRWGSVQGIQSTVNGLQATLCPYFGAMWEVFKMGNVKVCSTTYNYSLKKVSCMIGRFGLPVVNCSDVGWSKMIVDLKEGTFLG